MNVLFTSVYFCFNDFELLALFDILISCFHIYRSYIFFLISILSIVSLKFYVSKAKLKLCYFLVCDCEACWFSNNSWIINKKKHRHTNTSHPLHPGPPSSPGVAWPPGQSPSLGRLAGRAWPRKRWACREIAISPDSRVHGPRHEAQRIKYHFGVGIDQASTVHSLK